MLLLGGIRSGGHEGDQESVKFCHRIGFGLCQLQPMPSSFFSGRTGSAHLSLKLTKAPATRLLQQTYWMAFAVCSFWTGCKESTQAPPPVTVATPIRKEVVEWDEYTGRTEAVESVEVRRASSERELEKIGG